MAKYRMNFLAIGEYKVEASFKAGSGTYSNDNYAILCRWFSKSEDDGQIVRELFLKSDTPLLKSKLAII